MSLQKNILGTFSTRLLVTGLSFINSIFLVRLLGVEGNGDFAIFTANVALFTLLFSLGIHSAIAHFVAKEKFKIEDLGFSILIHIFGAGLLFGVLIWTLEGVVQVSIFLPGNLSDGIYRYILLVIFLSSFSSYFIISFLTGLNKFRSINQMMLISAVLFCVVYVILFYIHNNYFTISIKNIFITYAALHLASLFIAIGFYIKEIGLTPRFKFLKISEYKTLLAFAGFAFFTNGIQFLNNRLDYWFVEYYSGSLELGTYALAFSFMNLFWLLSKSVAAIVFPNAAKSGKEFLPHLTFLGRVLFLISLTAALLSIFLLNPIIKFVYGEEFSETSQLINILFIGGVFLSPAFLYREYLAGAGLLKLNFQSALVGLIFTIIFDFLLIPKFGNQGAAFATALSYLSTAFFLFYIFRKIYQIPIKDMFFNKNDFRKIYELIKNRKR